jgi:PAS domain S-box-containing protein
MALKQFIREDGVPSIMSSTSYSSYSEATPAKDLVVDVAHTTDGAFAVDLRQSIISWNAAAEELLGYGEQDVLGHKCGSVLGICGRPGKDCDLQWCNALSATIRGRLAPRIEVAVRDRAGDLHQLSMGTIAARSASGEMCIVHLFHDITPPDQDAVDDETGPSAIVRPSLLATHSKSRDVGADRASLQVTHREHEVLRLLAAGLSTRDIAATLSISPITVRNHITKVIEKLDVKTRLQAVVAAARIGLI